MNEELFITPSFSDEMLEAGAVLVKQLDEANAEVVAAFWTREDEKNWELILVSPLVESEGPRKYYARINDINEAIKPGQNIISLHDIRVTTIHNRLFKAIKNSTIHKLPIKTRLGPNRIGSEILEDLLLYRV